MDEASALSANRFAIDHEGGPRLEAWVRLLFLEGGDFASLTVGVLLDANECRHLTNADAMEEILRMTCTRLLSKRIDAYRLGAQIP